MGFNSAHLLTVEEVRNSYAFVIPEFQRGYAWNEEQWKALWDDVASIATRSGKDHYGGSIMLSSTDAAQGDVELIDGQQRMTSISLMLSALGAEGFPIQFRDNLALQTYYDYHALGNSDLGPGLKQHTSFYAKNIADASSFFKARAKALPTDADRERLVDALLSQVKIFVLGIHQDFDIHVAFETINNRGKPLSTLEKLKNRLIYLLASSGEGIDTEAAKSQIHRCWKQVYQSLGAGSALLDDDELLRAHAIGWFRHERNEGWLQQQLFERAFSAYSSPLATPEDILGYAASLERAAACWHLLNNSSSLPPEVDRRLQKLERTPSANAKPVLLWALIRLSEAHPGLLENPAQPAAWTESFNALVEQIERFNVLVILANDRISSVGQVDMFHAAFALAHPGTPLFRNTPKLSASQDADEAVGFIAQFLQSCIYNIDDDATPEDAENAVLLDPRFDREGEFELDQVQATIDKRFRRNSGYYNWLLGRLLVFGWEERLRGEKGRIQKHSWERFSWDGTVEHVYPRKPDSEWKKAILPNGKGKDAIQATIANSIGNLMLLSRPHNSFVSNKAYPSTRDVAGKREHYAKGGYSEVQIATLCKEWTIVQIAARGIAMLQHAQAMWDVELLPDDEPFIAWLPLLFGDHAERIRKGAAGMEIKERTLAAWVKKFSAL